MKVVDTGYKIDLHIHSVSSHGKDKGKVAFNTLEHIPVLAEKLNEICVQMCAITVHDVFVISLYSTVKKCELEEGSSIIKVFPGVEFWGENGGTEIK